MPKSDYSPELPQREPGDREREIWSLKCRGMREADIASRHGISQQRVSQIVTRMRARYPLADRSVKRHELSERLDEMRAMAADVSDLPLPPVMSEGAPVYDPETGALVRDAGGRLAALGVEAKLIDRQAKLLGLDAPAQVQTAQEITYVIKGADPDGI